MTTPFVSAVGTGIGKLMQAGYRLFSPKGFSFFVALLLLLPVLLIVLERIAVLSVLNETNESFLLATTRLVNSSVEYEADLCKGRRPS